MAYEQSLHYIELDCPSTAYSARQYRMVRADSTEGYFEQATTAAGVANTAIGVLQGAPTVAGEACQIGYGGITKILCGSTSLIPGDAFITASSGAAGSTSGAVAKQVLYGPWLSAAAAAGSIGTAMFNIIGITT